MRTILGIFVLILYSIGLGVGILPAAIGLAGFWFGCIAAVGVWLYIVFSSLLYLEATLANPDGANMLSISRNLIGKFGSIIGSVVYIYAHTSIITVYFLFGTRLFNELSENFFNLTPPNNLIHFSLFVGIAIFLYFGLRVCSWLTSIGLCCFLVVLISLIFQPTSSSNVIEHKVNWIYLILSIPILYSTLFIQSIIPSLATFLKRDWSKIKKVIWTGTGCALIILLVWLWIFIRSTTETSLLIFYQSYNTLYNVIHFMSKNPQIGNAIYFIASFAFIGTFPIAGIVLIDFYGDAFKLSPEKRRGWKQIGITLLTLVPPFIFSFLPMISIQSLINYSLGFSLIVITTVFPLIWVVSSRYIQHTPSKYKLRIKGLSLALYALVTLFFLYVEGIQLIRL